MFQLPMKLDDDIVTEMVLSLSSWDSRMTIAIRNIPKDV